MPLSPLYLVLTDAQEAPPPYHWGSLQHRSESLNLLMFACELLN